MTMEKPRKKGTYEHREINGMVEVDARYNAGWNDHADAMSTWIEGAVPSVLEIAEALCRADHPDLEFNSEEIPEYSGYFHYAKAIHNLLTQRLGDK